MYPLPSSAYSSGVPLNQSPDAKFRLPGFMSCADMYPSGVYMIIPWPFSPIGYRVGEPSTGVSIYETSFQAPINCSLKLFLSFVFAFIVRSVLIEVRVSILHILRGLSRLSCAVFSILLLIQLGLRFRHFLSSPRKAKFLSRKAK